MCKSCIRSIGFLLIMLLSKQVTAQDTLYFKLQNYYYSIKTDNPDFFYIRKTVPFDNGYKTWDYNQQQQLVAEGFFDDTLFTWKNGCFIFYENGSIKEKGCFVHDYKDGTWMTYDYKGAPYAKQEYVRGILVTDILVTAPVTAKENNPEHYCRSVYKEGNFPGGGNALTRFILDSLVYPPSLKAQRKEAAIVVQFIVQKDGSLTDCKIIKHADPLFEKAALDMLYKMPKWEPAEQNGRKVRTYQSLPVIFCLEDFTDAQEDIY